MFIFQALPFSVSLPGRIQGAMVGNPQMIQCTVSGDSGLNIDSVMISWMGPGGGTITNNSRVTITPTTSSGNTYTSSIQFTYLMEGDEGTYTCNVMSSTGVSESESVEIDTLTGNSTKAHLYTGCNLYVGSLIKMRSRITCMTVNFKKTCKNAA